MAKKKDNTLLYAGIAAAAILLLKKKDTGMAGVGARFDEDNYWLAEIKDERRPTLQDVKYDIQGYSLRELKKALEDGYNNFYHVVNGQVVSAGYYYLTPTGILNFSKTQKIRY